MNEVVVTADWKKVLFIFLVFFCLWSQVPSAIALLIGLVVAHLIGNPYPDVTRKWIPKFLGISIIGIGGGMNLLTVASVGAKGIGYTLTGISLTLGVGALLGKVLKIEEKISILISVGTAICGGSAIAAVTPVVGAKSHDVSVSLGTVFILNSVALFLFPWVGHHLNLDQDQFGMWCALAIHDTSSVVGATLQYGAHALEVGTTLKLARALWIVPVTLAVGLWFRSGGKAKPKFPYFILGFLLMAALGTWVPLLHDFATISETVGKRLMVVTLFLIGAGISMKTVRAVGFKPLLQGVILWIMTASATLIAVRSGLLSVR